MTEVLDIQELNRTLEEIFLRYELEPDIKDLYVEGVNDKKFIDWFLNLKERRDICVYTIDTVVLPLSISKEINKNNKKKVIVFSNELSNHADSPYLNVKCIIDRDCDTYLSKIVDNTYIEYTDYNSMESYFINIEFINKYVTLAINGLPFSTQTFYDELVGVLQSIFLIRLTNEALEWNLDWLSTIHKYLKWNNNSFEFEKDRFIDNLLRSNSKGNPAQITTFKEKMKELQTILEDDVRYNIRGHDFTQLFLYSLKKLKAKRSGYTNLETFEGSLYVSFDFKLVESELLFTKLISL